MYLGIEARGPGKTQQKTQKKAPVSKPGTF